MKKLTLLSLLCLCAQTLCAKTFVEWSCSDNLTDSLGKPYYFQRFVVKGNTDFKSLNFNMFARKMRTLDADDKIIEIVPGYYGVESGKYGRGLDSVALEIYTSGHLVNCCYAPDGVHIVDSNNTPQPVEYTRTPILRPGQWTVRSRDLMPYGPEIYDFNESLVTDWTPGPYDVIPSFSNVRLDGGESTIRHLSFVPPINGTPNDGSTIFVRNDSLIISCAPEKQWPVYLHFQTKVMGGRDKGVTLPNATITNTPGLQWRGIMIDVARNFMDGNTIGTVLKLMAANGLNVLHFHLVDDEAWRLEIKGLPELTAVGARRGYPSERNDDFLPQIFGGDGNPNSPHGSANGFYTRAEFIKLLQLANSLGIKVLPEIESPGHARAAIRAMEHRYHKTGDDTLRLIHDGDTSQYTSAQSFHDNVMNPALPGPYNFMQAVIDDIVAMYDEAGVPLPGIHIGGDEVPSGAWNGSEVAVKFMHDNNLKTQGDLHAYFVKRIAQMLAARGIPMHGWQEVALGHGQEYDNAVRPVTGGINCWSTLPSHKNASVTERVIGAGYPTILSNVDHLYFDLAYSSHPEEKGLNWGGYVDEFASFSAYPSQLCPSSDSLPGLLGLNAHVFAETLRTPRQLYTYLLPKIFGLAERAWNPKPTYSAAQYNAILGRKELPLFGAEGMATSVHMRQPGIKVINNMVYMNSPYGTPCQPDDPDADSLLGGVIRYTVDGSEPTATSQIYTSPFPYTENAKIRARLFRNNTESVTTVLN